MVQYSTNQHHPYPSFAYSIIANFSFALNLPNFNLIRASSRCFRYRKCRKVYGLQRCKMRYSTRLKLMTFHYPIIFLCSEYLVVFCKFAYVRYRSGQRCYCISNLLTGRPECNFSCQRPLFSNAYYLYSFFVANC